MASSLLQSIGRNRMLVGATMADATARAAPFDVRYMYLAGGLFDGSSPCTSCATNCNAGGSSCANSNPNGCAWWGCWQWDQNPPGQYLRDFLSRVQTDGQIPMITYYEILQASGASEGSGEVSAANNSSFMTRYFADWRFVLQQIGQKTALLHIEPDFWGYAERVNQDPRLIPAAVASANSTDCSSQENNIAGFGRCLIAMARKYAPNARVGLHASAWGTGIDVHLNSNPSFNVSAEAQKLGRFMTAAGAATGDFVVVEASDRDAGYYSSIGQNRWWDATNATLPNFNQAFTWAKALAEEVNKPLVWWQLPIGNMSLPNQTNAWRDNRVDYFFGHTQQITSSHGAIIAFGPGDGAQTTAETDGNNLINKVTAYKQSGGQVACP
jgi:hypothetical protein